MPDNRAFLKYSQRAATITRWALKMWYSFLAVPSLKSYPLDGAMMATGVVVNETVPSETADVVMTSNSMSDRCPEWRSFSWNDN